MRSTSCGAAAKGCSPSGSRLTVRYALQDHRAGSCREQKASSCFKPGVLLSPKPLRALSLTPHKPRLMHSCSQEPHSVERGAATPPGSLALTQSQQWHHSPHMSTRCHAMSHPSLTKSITPLRVFRAKKGNFRIPYCPLLSLSMTNAPHFVLSLHSFMRIRWSPSALQYFFSTPSSFHLQDKVVGAGRRQRGPGGWEGMCLHSVGARL